jgi:hypothetical protein
MIFPGMDPYLEDAQIWPGVHASFIVYLRDHLQPSLRPRYVAAVQERVYLEGPNREIIPDAWLRQSRPGSSRESAVLAEEDAAVLVEVEPLEVHEPYITILDRHSGQRVVTVIEVVSPTNKYAGPGRESYLAKQREVLGSDAHLVEIDLLRTGPHALAVPEYKARGKGFYDYLISLNRATKTRTGYALYLCTVRERLPRIKIPLADPDPDVRLDLQGVLNHTYEQGSYRDRLNYDVPCKPPLSPADQAWALDVVRAATQPNGPTG